MKLKRSEWTRASKSSVKQLFFINIIKKLKYHVISETSETTFAFNLVRKRMGNNFRIQPRTKKDGKHSSQWTDRFLATHFKMI